MGSHLMPYHMANHLIVVLFSLYTKRIFFNVFYQLVYYFTLDLNFSQKLPLLNLRLTKSYQVIEVYFLV